MGFTSKYLERCYISRGLWKTKSTYPGDWYLAGDPLDLHLVGESDVERVDFHSGAIAFVPDADDLLELVDNQIRAAGGDPATKALTIRYDPEGLWSLDIEYGGKSTHVRGQESVHSLLSYALYLMAQPVV